jgi:hypothetical protein
LIVILGVLVGGGIIGAFIVGIISLIIKFLQFLF